MLLLTPPKGPGDAEAEPRFRIVGLAGGEECQWQCGSATITMVIWGVRFLRRFLGSFQPYKNTRIIVQADVSVRCPIDVQSSLPCISIATLTRQEAVHACCRSHFTEGINVATVLFKQRAACRSIIMPIYESPEELLRFELVTVDHMARSVAMVECSELRRCVRQCYTVRGCLQVPATWQCICNRVRR